MDAVQETLEYICIQKVEDGKGWLGEEERRGAGVVAGRLCCGRGKNLFQLRLLGRSQRDQTLWMMAPGGAATTDRQLIRYSDADEVAETL